jgi:hypothetical protein
MLKSNIFLPLFLFYNNIISYFLLKVKYEKEGKNLPLSANIKNIGVFEEITFRPYLWIIGDRFGGYLL